MGNEGVKAAVGVWHDVRMAQGHSVKDIRKAKRKQRKAEEAKLAAKKVKTEVRPK